MISMKRAALAAVVLCLGLLALPGASFAACTQTGNTAGTDIAAIVANTYGACQNGAPTSIPDGGDVTLGAKADAKSTATDTTPVTIMQVLKELSALLQTPSDAGSGGLKTLCVLSTGAACDYTTNVNIAPYPGGSTNVSCSTGNVAASTATCTMPATTGKFTYLTGFDITSSGSTAATVVTCTVTNTDSGTHSYTYTSVAGVTLKNDPLSKTFTPPLKATAANTAPVISCPSLGSGNTNTTINAYGYELP